ncbi:hypothetical protein RHGRI_007560 [Rhododendron griersonianum]|uniref:Uncharacterized protein n=1 Tax=Rhododendron griersonianum TaxID=479676 RepID=A0AAV6KYP2_9ERIC|nr:hypothetical protein RHGRI_007560 [Rhododendron griersonianum]
MDPENIHFDNERLHHDLDDGGPTLPPGREFVGEAASNIAAVSITWFIWGLYELEIQVRVGRWRMGVSDEGRRWIGVADEGRRWTGCCRNSIAFFLPSPDLKNSDGRKISG